MKPIVLVVDGDRNLCGILAKALEGAGFRTLQAHDGAAALAAMRADCPSLVLMDVLFPRRDGFDVLAEIRGLPAPEGEVPAACSRAVE